MQGELIFITGGVRSGKSSFAELQVAQLVEEYQLSGAIYIATSVVLDQEMAQRVSRHQLDRQNVHFTWCTVEVEVDFTENIKLSKSEIIIFECITTWLGNVFFKYENQQGTERLQNIQSEVHNFMQCMELLQQQGNKVYIISNEILDAGFSLYEEVNIYQKVLGELHQQLVRSCHQAYEVQSKFIKKWK